MFGILVLILNSCLSMTFGESAKHLNATFSLCIFTVKKENKDPVGSSIEVVVIVYAILVSQ